jgi:hypothetical protein
LRYWVLMQRLANQLQAQGERHSDNKTSRTNRENTVVTSRTIVYGEMVGVERFELPALWSQTRCATRLRYTPTMLSYPPCYGISSIHLVQNTIYFTFLENRPNLPPLRLVDVVASKAQGQGAPPHRHQFPEHIAPLPAIYVPSD